MRLSLRALPVPLALAFLLCTGADAATSLTTPPAHSPLATHSLFVRPRFLPPALLQKRQATAAGTTGGTTDSGVTAEGVSVNTDTAAQQTTTQAAATTTQAQQTTTAAVATTTQAQQTTSQAETTEAEQATSQAQTTSQAAETTTTQPPAGTTTTSADSTSSNAQPPASSSSSPPPSSSSPTDSSSASAPSSQTSSTSSSSKTASTSFSEVEVTFTSTFTNSDGSLGTSTGTTMTPSAVPIKNNTSSSSTGKTWGIIGGVVGGVAVVGALVFIVYRMTQRRFSSIDDAELEIKWPELQPDGQTISTSTSTLKPLDTHRTAGAGIGDEGSEWGDQEEPYMAGGNRHSTGTLLGLGALQHYRNASYEQLAMADQVYSHNAGVYDPFLGASSAPYPPPQNVYPPPHYPYGAGGPGAPSDSTEYLVRGPMGAPGAAGSLREGAGTPPPRDMFAASDARRSMSGTPPPRIASPPMRQDSPFTVPGAEYSSSMSEVKAGPL
ncbi:hypothetical protein JCM21900_005151 [Sporobolomyces salmonicolor]